MPLIAKRIISNNINQINIQHKYLDQLVHGIYENNFYEITRSSGKVVNETWWTDDNKTIKIREADYTYTANKISQIVYKQYNVLGVLVETYTENINRSGNTIISIDGVFS